MVKVFVPIRVIFSANPAMVGETLIKMVFPPSAEKVIGVIELFAQTLSVRVPPIADSLLFTYNVTGKLRVLISQPFNVETWKNVNVSVTTSIVGVPVIVITFGPFSISLSANNIVAELVFIPISKVTPEVCPVKTSVVPLTVDWTIAAVEPASIRALRAIKTWTTVVPLVATS